MTELQPRPDRSRIHPARRAGQIVLGLALGLALPAALFALISLAAGISPFNYQGY